MTEIRDALLLRLKQSGFISCDDGTVALFKGSFAVGEDSVTPVVWTSAEKLVEALLARFEIRDRQAEPTWRCARCGSDRWGGWRAGPEHEGYPRKAQCVPCGHVQDLPADSEVRP